MGLALVDLVANGGDGGRGGGAVDAALRLVAVGGVRVRTSALELLVESSGACGPLLFHELSHDRLYRFRGRYFQLVVQIGFLFAEDWK